LKKTTVLQIFAYSQVSIYVSHENYGSKNGTEEDLTWREFSIEIIMWSTENEQ
jgi:hypothetical protein